MKVINLNNTTDTFYLGDRKYTYTPKDEDRIYFVEKIKNLKEAYLQEELKEIFKYLLEYENQDIEIKDEDLNGLLVYFIQKLL